jgi:hypothetical protein
MYYARRKHTFKSVLLGMGSGAAALLLLHYFGAPLGYQPELGLFNMSTALVLGVPGVALIFIVNKFL